VSPPLHGVAPHFRRVAGPAALDSGYCDPPCCAGQRLLRPPVSLSMDRTKGSNGSNARPKAGSSWPVVYPSLVLSILSGTCFGCIGCPVLETSRLRQTAAGSVVTLQNHSGDALVFPEVLRGDIRECLRDAEELSSPPPLSPPPRNSRLKNAMWISRSIQLTTMSNNVRYTTSSCTSPLRSDTGDFSPPAIAH